MRAPFRNQLINIVEANNKAMLWLILSLFSALSQSSRDFFSKKCLQDLNEYVLAFSRSFFALPFLLPFLFFTGMPNLDTAFWILVLFNSALISVAAVLYMRAIKISPLSLTVPMLAFTPLFLIITSPIMVGEFPSFFGLIGIVLITFGTYTLNIRDISHAPKRAYFAPLKALLKEKGPLIMLFVAAIFSIGANLFKIAIQRYNPLFFLVVYNTLNCVFLSPVMLLKSKKSIKGMQINSKFLFGVGLSHALMDIFVLKAMELAIVPYVISVKRTNILFTTVYGYFLFKEKRIMERLIGALIMFLGVLLISLF